MTVFIPTPSSAAINQPPPAEQPIANDGFFPDIEPARVREEARIPDSSITPARLRAAILGAILTAGYDLTLWATRQIASGYPTLADVPAPKLDGQNVQLIRYQRAIALLAKAELIERHRDFDTTAAGGAQVDDLLPSIDELRRDAQHALRELQGRARTMIDLI